LADEMWANLVSQVDPKAPDSVHLADWPDYDVSLIDQGLRDEMQATRRAVALGLQTRTTSKLKVRQPLATATISGTDATKIERLKALIADELNVKHVIVTENEPDGATASDGGITVTLDTTLTDELRAEGTARDIVRAVQNLRKKSGLAVSDRIRLGLDVPDPLWNALEPHRDWIAGEVLASDISRGRVAAADGTADVAVDGAAVSITLSRA
jgi:isoleucyl-tRNA synthetase